MDIWEDLEPLRLDPTMGPEIITMGALWKLAGGRQRRLDITVKILAEHFARDGHSFRDHLEKLFRRGCVQLLARDRRRGRFLVVVLHPEFALPMDRRDKRQMHLPGAWTAGVKDMDDFIRRHPEDLTAAVNDGRLPSGDPVLAPGESPADESRSSDTGEAQSPVHREPQTARSADARRAFGAGIFPDPVAGNSPPGQPTGGENPASRKSHGEIPASGPHGENPATSRGNPRDESLAAVTSCVTGKSPRPHGEIPVSDSHGEIPVTNAPYIPHACAPRPRLL